MIPKLTLFIKDFYSIFEGNLIKDKFLILRLLYWRVIVAFVNRRTEDISFTLVQLLNFLFKLAHKKSDTIAG